MSPSSAEQNSAAILLWLTPRNAQNTYMGVIGAVTLSARARDSSLTQETECLFRAERMDWVGGGRTDGVDAHRQKCNRRQRPHGKQEGHRA